ncbi:MAG: molybdate ABC transporter substrate-binding protein [Solirubrobacterales bacterium]|nr:molybdate ABC transporter substrate-binding protein [Solirubrobacterales bacterium]
MSGLRTFLLIGACVVVSACGGSATNPLAVSSATSLKAPVTAISALYPNTAVQLEFAGSDAIATAIRSGRKPDVFLSASLKIPKQLAEEGLVGKPVVFARNRLVVAVRSGTTNINSFNDLAKPGISLALGSPSVPIGAYADAMLGKLPALEAAAIRTNVKTREPDAASVAAKVTGGVVDGAILYASDVKASNGRLLAITIPSFLYPLTKCAAVVVNGTKYPLAAAAFIKSLLLPQSQRALWAAGFLPPA